jgi:hypothetical protein
MMLVHLPDWALPQVFLIYLTGALALLFFVKRKRVWLVAALAAAFIALLWEILGG